MFDAQERQSTVWTYIAIPMGKGAFAPHKDYIALYVKGAVYFGLPAAYVDSLKKIADGSKKS